MPPKANPRAKYTKAERKAHQAKQKAARAPSQQQPRPQGKRRRRRPKGFRKLKNMSNRAVLAAIGSALVNPADSPPLRFPTLTGRATDVKHVYQLDELQSGKGNIVVTTPAARDVSGNFGGQDSDIIVILTRDPVAPVYYTRRTFSVAPYGSLVNMPRKNWYSSADAKKAAGNPSFWIDSPGQLKSTAGTRTATPNLVFAPCTYTTNTIPEPPTIDSLNNYWDWYPGGVYQLNLSHYTGATTGPLPAGCSVIVYFTPERYISPTDVEEFDEIALTIPTATTTATYWWAPNVQVSPRGESFNGFYRFRVKRVDYSAPTADNVVGDIAVAIGLFYPSGTGEDLFVNTTNYEAGTGTPLTVRYAMTTLVVHPTAANIGGGANLATYMYEECRVTAASVLLKNTTAQIYKSGDIYGAVLPEEKMHRLTPNLITNAAGKRRTGYRGELAAGGYTWMEMPEAENMAFRNCVPEVVGGTGNRETFFTTVGVARIAGYGNINVLYARPGFNTGEEASQFTLPTFQLRVDQHLEFISESQLAMLAVSPFKLDDLMNASKALGNAPLITENFIHIKELWQKLKDGGRRVLAAGGRSLAMAAMSELASGIGTLML